MNIKTRILVMTALLAALTLALGLLPIGYITIVPGFIEITIMCVPVVVGSLTLGWRAGMSLGLVFAITSVIAALTRSPLGQVLLDYNAALTLVLLVVPRVLVPVGAHLVYRYVRTKSENLRLGIAGAAGSLVNTVLFLTLLSAMFGGLVGAEIFTFAAFVNGSIEAALSALVCIPVVKALRKSVPNLVTDKPTGQPGGSFAE